MMRWRIPGSVVISLIAIAILLLFFVGRPVGHRLMIKCYFANGMGLRAGAPVRLAGVDIGVVKKVLPHPERKADPVEVVMRITTSYQLKIPNDSIASLQTDGFLGAPFVEIESTSAFGPAVQENAILKSKTTNQISAEQIVNRVAETISKKPCDCAERPDSGESQPHSQHSNVPH